MRSISAVGVLAAAVLALAALPGLASDPVAIAVERPWARATVLPSRPAVAYLTIVNRGAAADRLVAVASPVAGHVMIHESRVQDGIARMTTEAALRIEPGARVELKPGGLHLMLMDLRQPLRRGESFELTLRFETAGEVVVAVPVAAAGAMGPE